jgi:hypothetical protein
LHNLVKNLTLHDLPDQRRAPLSRAFPFSGKKVSQAKRGSPKVVEGRPDRPGVVSKDWL